MAPEHHGTAPGGSPNAAAADAAPWSPTPVVTDDGSVTLWSPRYGETFRSRHGAVAESRHVFLEGSGVGSRLAAGLDTRVVEVGLGAATNLALTVAAALEGGARVDYRAWERTPLPAEAWEAAGLGDLAPAGFVAAWLAWRRSWTPHGPAAAHVGSEACPTPAAAPEYGAADASAAPIVHTFRYLGVRVDVVIGDVAAAAARGSASVRPSAGVHAVYHDPFSPERNPEAWTPHVLGWLAAQLAPGGALVSYSVQGRVRRALADAGLEVRKVAGPAGGKREVLVARRHGDPADGRRCAEPVAAGAPTTAADARP